jgi:signal transduction histidine kinase
VTRTTLAGHDVQLPVYSVQRFAADCGRLLADVDRLISDIGIVIENHNGHSKTGRRPGHRSQLNGAALTLRQHAESFLTTLQHSTSFHRRVPIPFMELDEKATILRTNNEGNVALNGAGKPITGKSLFNYVAESDVERLREHLQLCKRTDKACVIQTLIKGKGLPVELRIRRHPVGKATGFLAVILTSGVESDGIFAGQRWDQPLPISLQELSSSLNRVYTLTSVIQLLAEYCSTVLASPAGIIFIERDSKPHVARQWQSRPFWKKVLLRGVLTKGLVKQVFRTGNPAFWSPTKNSQHGVTFFPISSSGEHPAGVVAMIALHHATMTSEFGHDLRRLGEVAYASFARARAYDDAVAAYSEAQKANRRKEELLSVISHELKNPLAPVLGWAIALSSGELSSEKQSLAVEGIIRNARALNYLIEDLFDLARISSGKLRLNKTEMRLQEVVREALTAIQPAAENKKLRIATDISEAIPPFVADPRRLRQMIINLLNNAVKFTPGGGSIALKVVKRSQCVECVVSDSGKGIDHKFLPFVFDRFRQENRSQQSATMGLGLGLTIVREIAELHGGRVTAYSAGPNHGATFTVQLPIRLRRRT